MVKKKLRRLACNIHVFDNGSTSAVSAAFTRTFYIVMDALKKDKLKNVAVCLRNAT
jgi:hypothetical protein